MALGTAYPVLKEWHLVLLNQCSENGTWYCLSSAPRMALGTANPVLRRWHLVLVISAQRMALGTGDRVLRRWHLVLLIQCSEDGTWYC